MYICGVKAHQVSVHMLAGGWSSFLCLWACFIPAGVGRSYVKQTQWMRPASHLNVFQTCSEHVQLFSFECVLDVRQMRVVHRLNAFEMWSERVQQRVWMHLNEKCIIPCVLYHYPVTLRHITYLPIRLGGVFLFSLPHHRWCPEDCTHLSWRCPALHGESCLTRLVFH